MKHIFGRVECVMKFVDTATLITAKLSTTIFVPILKINVLLASSYEFSRKTQICRLVSNSGEKASRRGKISIRR